MEELTRFFMEGRSNLEIELGRSRDQERESDSEKDGGDEEQNDESDLVDEETLANNPDVLRVKQYRSLLREPVDPRVFNPMLSMIRESEPLLYGAVLCHPLVAGHEAKKEKKKKKKEKEKEILMLVPDFNAEPLSKEETLVNLSRFVAKAIADGSIRALLLAIKIVLTTANNREFYDSTLPVGSHLIVLDGGEAPKMPKLKATDSKDESSSSDKNTEKASEAMASMELDVEDDSISALTARLSRFVNRVEDAETAASFEADDDGDAGLDEEALMAQAIALSLSSDIEKEESQDENSAETETKEEATAVPRPTKFSAGEMRSLWPFKHENEKIDVDLLTLCLRLVAKLNEYCTAYVTAAQKNILLDNAPVQPHPLTFLLLTSLLENVQMYSIGSNSLDRSRWRLLQSSSCLVLLRTLDVNFFHIEVTKTAPASVGLGQVDSKSESFNPLLKRLCQITNQLMLQKYQSVADDDPVALLLDPTEAPTTDSINQVANLYDTKVQEQAMSTWVHGVPHFYPSHSERRHLLMSLLSDCSFEWKNAAPSQILKWHQLDLFCGRMSLPDLVKHFIPETIKARDEPECKSALPTTGSLITDEIFLMAHSGKDIVAWTPHQIRQSLVSGVLSGAVIIEYLLENTSPHDALDPHNIDGIVAIYTRLWENTESVDTQSAYELLDELPHVIDALMQSVSLSEWPTFGQHPEARMFTPLLNVSGVEKSTLTNTHSLNYRVLLLRSIQDLMLRQIGGSKENKPAPPDFDSSRCAETITLCDGGLSAKQHTAKQWGMVMVAKGCDPNTGTHEWAVRLDKCEKGHIFIGVCTREASIGTYVGGDRHGWGLIGTRALWHNRSKVRGDFGDGFTTGSVVNIRLNTDSGALSFGVDDSDWGVAFDGLTQCGTLYPAVGLYQRDDQVTILPVSQKRGKNELPKSMELDTGRNIATDPLPLALTSFLRYSFSLFEECCKIVDDYGNTEAIDAVTNPLIVGLLPALLSSLCLLRTSNGLPSVLAMQLLPWGIRFAKKADYVTRKLNCSGLRVPVCGEWELKSMAAGSIPAQQYRLTVKQNDEGHITGSSSGSFSAVSFEGAVKGTKIRFLETWRQGGTCLVEGRLRADGSAFFGIYEDTKSHTCGCIVGNKLQQNESARAKDVQTLVVLEMLSALLIGKYSGSLIVGENAERFSERRPQQIQSTEGATPVSSEENELGPGVEISSDAYVEWVKSDLLSGGLPASEIQGHLQQVMQRVAEVTKQSCSEQMSGISSTVVEWLDAILPSCFQAQSGKTSSTSPTSKAFLSDMIAARHHAALVDKWVLRHVGESPFLRVGGDTMRVARRTVVAAMIWHTGGVQEVEACLVPGTDNELDQSEIRPHERLMQIWRGAQRVIEWAIRSKMTMGSTYSTMASFVIQKARFLLELEPCTKVAEMAMGPSSSFSSQDPVQAAKSASPWEDYSKRVHSEMLMQISRFLEASVRISKLRSIMQTNCTRAFLRVIGLSSIRRLLNDSSDSKSTGLQLSNSIGTVLQWLSASLCGHQPELDVSRSSHTTKGSYNVAGRTLSTETSYYLGGLGGCGKHLQRDLREAFENLYGLLASGLSRATWAGDFDLQLAVLQSWGIVIQPDDHAFLSRVGIFRVLQTVLDEARSSDITQDGDVDLPDDCGILSESRKRLVQAALKVVHLLAAQVANAGDDDSVPSVGHASIAFSRKPSGPETLGKSVFNMLYTELRNAVGEVREESTRSSGITSSAINLLSGNEPTDVDNTAQSSSDSLDDASEAHHYCYQIVSLLFSVSGASTCRSNLSSSRWLRLLFALVDCGTPAIQRRVLRLLRRLLPSVDPSAIRIQLESRPFECFDVDSDDDIVESATTDDESRHGISLVYFLLDIIGSVMPQSLPATMVQGSPIPAVPGSFGGSLFDLSYDKASLLASEVVVLLRTLHASSIWKDLLNVAFDMALSNIPVCSVYENDVDDDPSSHDADLLQSKCYQWMADDKCYRRAYSALSVLGGHLDGLHVGGSVKILPRSGSTAQEVAFRGARGTLVSYDPQKPAAEVLIKGLSPPDPKDRNESPNLAEGAGSSAQNLPSGAAANGQQQMRPVRVPVDDLSAVSEVEADVEGLSDQIGSSLCSSQVDYFLTEIQRSLRVEKDENDKKANDESVEANDNDGEESNEPEESQEKPEEVVLEKVGKEIRCEEQLNRTVLCLLGFRAVTRILREPRFSQHFILPSNDKMASSRLRKLFEIAVTRTKTSGLGDISYLEENWLFLWSRWYNMRRDHHSKLMNPEREVKSQANAGDENAALPPPSEACQQMMEMGFPREWCDVALARCGRNVEAAINFCFEHSGDMERFLKQNEDSASQSSSSSRGLDAAPSIQEERNPLLDQLAEMGFPIKWCKKALESNRNNVDAALTWILSNGEALEAEDRREEEDAQRKANGGADGADDEDPATKPKRVGPNPLTAISGQASVGDDLCVEGLTGGGFASVGARQCLVTSGKWYYEATLHTSGCIQIGWSDVAFKGSSERGDGVGDGIHSWAYDGWRQQKWHGSSSPWGSKWKAGDVVGCAVDVDAGVLIFSLNGKMRTASMGVAFRGIKFSGGLYPCASFNRRERLEFNMGGLPFKYPPPSGFKPILHSIWTPETIGDVDLTIEDCLEEQVGEDQYNWESRYFGKEMQASFLRVANLHQRFTSSTTSSSSRTELLAELKKLPDSEVYTELMTASRALAVLHARQALLTLLSKWPIELVGHFCLSKEGPTDANFVDFVKLVASLSGQLSGAPILTSISDSPFLDQDISRLLDSGASGRHALFLLAPIVRSAIIDLKTNHLKENAAPFVQSLINFVSAQIKLAVERKYAKIPWDASDSSVTTSLLQLSTTASANWTDRDTMEHPNIVLAEWLSKLLLEAASRAQVMSSEDEIRLRLFTAWSSTLKSPSMCLKDKGFRLLSVILQDVLPEESLVTETSTASSQHLTLFLDSLPPIERLIAMVKKRIEQEKRHVPVCSKYLQSCVEFSSSLHLACRALNQSIDSSRNTTRLIDAAKELDQVLFSIDLEEIERAREVAKVRKENEAMQQEEELEKKRVEDEQSVPAEEDSKEVEGDSESNMDVEATASEETEATGVSSGDNTVDQVTQLMMEHEDLDAKATDIVSVIGKQIFLSQKKLLSLKASSLLDDPQGENAAVLLNADGGMVFPEEQVVYDTSDLSSEEIAILQSAHYGNVGKTRNRCHFGSENGILSDSSRSILYSGTIIQTKKVTETIEKDSNCAELNVGCKVIRGPDWKWRDQDGGENSVGIVEGISPWSGVEGEGMSVRWPNESLYTYRWGADGHHDLTHVEVDTDGNIVKKYPPPAKKQQDGSFGAGLHVGILVRLCQTSDDGVLHGIIEYPDFHGAEVRVVGRRNMLDGSFWFQELELVRGNPDMGWSLRFGREQWQPGTKYKMKLDPSTNDSTLCRGSYDHHVLHDGKLEDVHGEVELSQKYLFTMDPQHHFSTVKISPDRLSVTCTGGESRNLALATVGFTAGVHYWEVKVDKAEFGSVFIGVCEKASPPGSQAALSTRLNRWHGWGFVNFRATYHNSTERIYGDHFNAGDTIGVKLDMDKGKLSFFMDGIKYGEHIVADLGVAFDNLQGDHTGLRKTVFPCIGLRKHGDSISLNGKWVSKPPVSSDELLEEIHDVSYILHSWVQSQKIKQPAPLPESLLQEAFKEYNQWKAERWQRYPIRPRGLIVDFDTSIEACTRVSKAAGLSTAFLAGDRVRICTSGNRELDQPEEAVILGVYRDYLWYRTETQGNEGAEEGRAWAWYWTSNEMMGLLLIRRRGKDMTLLENSPDDMDKSIPDVATLFPGCNLEYDQFVRAATENWLPDMDTKLVDGVNALCDAVGLEAYNLQFRDICTKEEQLVCDGDQSSDSSVFGGRSRTLSVLNHCYFSELTLGSKSGHALRARCAVLRVLNGKLMRALPFIGLDGNSDDEIDRFFHLVRSETSSKFISTGQRLCEARCILFSSTKRQFWDDLLRSTTTNTPLPSDEYEDPREIRAIRINRIQAQASKLSLLPQPSDRLRRSVFGQLYREMRTWNDSAFRRAYCGKGHGGQKRAFKVKFLGEGVNDYGGPYRAVFEQIVDELQMDNVELTQGEQGLLPLLVPCPNRRSGNGFNQDKFVLNPSCGTSGTANGPMALELHRFLGKLIGTAVRHGLQMGLDFSSVVWRPLAGLSLSRGDLEQIDHVTCNLLTRISQMTRSDWEAMDCLTFVTHLSDGVESLLEPNGKENIVTYERRMEYATLVEQKRLTESTAQLRALWEGLSSVLPMAIAPLFTPEELEVLICGRRQVDVELLKQCTEYEEVDEQTPYVEFFWQVLEEMTTEERTKFLRFVWARSRMPNSAKDFPMNFKIQAAHDQGARKNPDQYLPHAQTCFFSLSLPAYSTKEILRQKLLFAIENSPNMDADVRLHNAEGWADA